MDDQTIRSLLVDFQAKPLPDVVDREAPLPEAPGQATALIGMRRSGKTYRLFDEMRRLVGEGVPRSRMLFLNLEDDRLGQPDSRLLDRSLELFFELNPSGRDHLAYVFLDEIQVVSGWERFARRLLDTENVRLYVTGSSARLLSTEVATQFRGRSITAEVLPYSMREAAQSDGHDWPPATWPPSSAQRSRMDAFVREYLTCGGFPAVRSLNSYDRIQSLQEYVELVVLRDVAERYTATNLVALRALVRELFAANANRFSVSKIHGALTSQAIRVGKPTLIDYLDHLVDAYLFFLVPIRTRSARQRSVNPRKCYSVDPGLAAAMYQAGARNLGAQLENSVYLDLRRRLGRLSDSAIAYYKTSAGREVDFAIDDPTTDGPPELIQVCTGLDDPATRSRELKALEEAMQETGATSGTVVTLADSESIQTAAGTIRICPGREWFFSPTIYR